MVVEQPKWKLLLTPLDTVRTSKQEFLDENCVVPMGAVTIFAGRGGEGKTTLALDYVARVTTGKLKGDYLGKPRNVLIISSEDDLSTQLKPKLIAAGFTDGRVAHVQIEWSWADGTTSKDVPSLLKHLPAIREAIEQTDPLLIVFDPLMSSMEGDANRPSDVRRSLQPLMGLLHEYNLACIAIAHVNKGTGTVAGDRLSGSHTFRDVARSLLLFAHDKEADERICTQDKSSYSPNGTDSFKFKLVTVTVPTDDGRDTTVAKVELLGPSTQSVSDIWAMDRDPDAAANQGAKGWLREYLEAAGGPVLQSEIVAAGDSYGYALRTLQEAARRLKVVRTGGGHNGPVSWSLPVTDASHASHASHADPLGLAPNAPNAPNTENELPL